MRLTDLQARLRPHLAALAPGLLAVGLMVVWSAHDGGYDADTWYWGTLLLLGTLAAVVIGGRARRPSMSRLQTAALLALGLYVAWSYVSISWAQSPGDALQGSNRALLYLIAFALLAALPWTREGALTALVVFAAGVGVVAIVLLFRLASGDHIGRLIIEGRLAAPTGYFNSTAALFTMDALTATALASRRELPGLLRGMLIAFAAAGLQLALIVQSRGWLFTLPLVAIVAIMVVRDRLRTAVFAVLPIAAALAPLHRLLDVYKSASGPMLGAAASRAGHAALISCALALVVGTLAAWSEQLFKIPTPGPTRRRLLGALVTTSAVVAVCVAGVAATHGHPVRFITRQWRGFSHPQTVFSSASHFADVGSGRYDFWRVSLDAFVTHPIGGLGQDNFADYYVSRRRTSEETAWTHSLELRLLVHTGFVGLGLFAGFLVAAIAAALRSRRRAPGLNEAVAGAALLPLAVWLIHGSIDWFWEMPALAGPALGFLAMAGALGGARADRWAVQAAEGAAVVPANEGLEAVSGSKLLPGFARRGIPGPLLAVTGAVLLLAAATVLAFPYLSVRETSVASDLRQSNPERALRDLATAADLNPLSAEPGRVGGTIALQSGQYEVAEQRFGQATAREPGGWYAWLGAGLAASALGDRVRARHDYGLAAAINPGQPVVLQALARVDGAHPLTPLEAFKLIAVRG